MNEEKIKQGLAYLEEGVADGSISFVEKFMPVYEFFNNNLDLLSEADRELFQQSAFVYQAYAALKYLESLSQADLENLDNIDTIEKALADLNHNYASLPKEFQDKYDLMAIHISGVIERVRKESEGLTKEEYDQFKNAKSPMLQSLEEKHKLKKLNAYASTKRKVAAVLVAASLVGSISGCIKTNTKDVKVEKTQSIEKDVKKDSTNIDKQDDKNTLQAEFKKAYKDLVENHGKSFVESANEHGIFIENEDFPALALIANIDYLNDAEKKLLASKDNVFTMNDILDFSVQIGNDVRTMSEDGIPFDANDLFCKDSVNAERINKLYSLISQWNQNRGDANIQAEYDALIDEVVKEFQDSSIEKKNYVAYELILNMAAHLATPGIDLKYSNEDQIGKSLFDELGNNVLQDVRIAMQDKLAVDFTLIKDENAEMKYDSIMDAKAFENNEFLKSYIGNDVNKALQLRFALNASELQNNQLKEAANSIDINGMTENAETFAQEFAKKLVSGEIKDFDSSLIFINEMDQENLSAISQIVKDAQQGKADNDKYNEFYYKYIERDNTRLQKNPIATALLINIMAEVENSDLGLHANKVDTHPAADKNGTKNLANILIGDNDQNISCKTQTALYQDGLVIAQKSFREQALISFENQMENISIVQGTSINVDAQKSAYQAILLEYKEVVNKESVNRYKVVVDYMNKVSHPVFKQNPNVEDTITNLLNAQDTYSNGYSISGASYDTYASNTGIVEDESYTDIDGPGTENVTLPVWTSDQVTQTEETASAELELPPEEKEEILDNVIEVGDPTEETIWVPVEEDQDLSESGDALTEEEKNELKENDETFVGKDENDKNIDYDENEAELPEEDILANKDELLDALEKKFLEGKITQEEYEHTKAVIENGGFEPNEEQSKDENISNENQNAPENNEKVENAEEDEKETSSNFYVEGGPVDSMPGYVWHNDNGEWVIYSSEQYENGFQDEIIKETIENSDKQEVVDEQDSIVGTNANEDEVAPASLDEEEKVAFAYAPPAENKSARIDEENAKSQAEEEAKAQAEAAEKARQEEEAAKLQAEQEAKAQAEAAEKARQEEEAARLQAEQEAQAQAAAIEASLQEKKDALLALREELTAVPEAQETMENVNTLK